MEAAISGVNASIRSVTGIFSDPITPTNRLSTKMGTANARTKAKNAKGLRLDGGADVNGLKAMFVTWLA